jgi:membrane-bound ClpP family serine protease
MTMLKTTGLSFNGIELAPGMTLTISCTETGLSQEVSSASEPVSEEPVSEVTSRAELIKKYEEDNNTKLIIIDGEIEIEYAHKFIREFGKLDINHKVDIIINTIGGDDGYSQMITEIINNHKGPVVAHIPLFALSAGTFIALSTDIIMMNKTAYLGVADTIYTTEDDTYSTSNLLKLQKNKSTDEIDDDMLLTIYDAEKSHNVGMAVLRKLLLKNYEEKQIALFTKEFISGKYVHDYVFSYNKLKNMGIKIDEISDDIINIFEAKE